MNEQAGRPPITILASPAELAGRSRIWGTGGWQPPEEREARDWLVLARVLGWKAVVETDLKQGLHTGSRVLVIAVRSSMEQRGVRAIPGDAVSFSRDGDHANAARLGAIAGQCSPRRPPRRSAGERLIGSAPARAARGHARTR
jgi:hypothetical protein